MSEGDGGRVMRRFSRWNIAMPKIKSLGRYGEGKKKRSKKKGDIEWLDGYGEEEAAATVLLER